MSPSSTGGKMLNPQAGEVTPIIVAVVSERAPGLHRLVDLGVLDHERTRRCRDPAVLPVLGMSAPIRKGYASSGAASLHRRSASESLRGC